MASTSGTTETRQWESALDGISNLKLNSAQVPAPSPSQILVKIHCVSLNYKDGETINGLFKHHKSSNTIDNLVPCSDGVGTVVAVGSDVKQWKNGDRVLSTCFPTHLTGQFGPQDFKSGVGSASHGVLTEYRLFEDWAVVNVPAYLTDEEACTFTIAPCTAWMGLQGWKYKQPEHKTVLIQGTGGVSISGLQLAKALGLKVVITSSSDAKLERAKQLGADYTINYRNTPAWDEEVLRVTDGKGVDIILENGGAHTTSKSFNCIAFGGRIASIGYVSGKTDPPEDRMNINVRALMKNFQLEGILNGPRDRLEEVLAFSEEKKLKPVVDKVFTFDQAKDALDYLWSGSHFGKVVIKVAS
jgi:NADPH:quinone reductase-like Zn-dependent oxidoreductase